MKRKPITAIILLILFSLAGCEPIDFIASRVNRPKQFEASYILKKTDYLTSPAETNAIIIELKTRKNKFSIDYYELGQPVLKKVYNGKTLWLVFRKGLARNQDLVVYGYTPYSTIKDKVYFWRMPRIKNLPPPKKQPLDGLFCYVYKYTLERPEGHTEITIYIDQDDFVIKKINKKVFLKTYKYRPISEWDLECKMLRFRADIDDGIFNYRLPDNAKKMSFQEAEVSFLKDIEEILKTNEDIAPKNKRFQKKR
jgi:outer membrane lipoprotein-sorting protein